MNEEKDILDEIFVDKNEPVDKKVLVDILSGYVTLDKEGIINFSEEYEELVGYKKVLIYICSKKAMVLKNIEGIKESASQSEVSEKAHVTLDIARNTMHKKYKKLLKKEGEGYIIPNYNLRKVKEILENKDG
jgi:hypothetical protein